MGHYGAAISVLNVALFVSSTACLYLSSIMINIYLLPYLEAVNSHFATVPYLILAIGMLLFLISLLGLAAAATKSKPALISYAALMSVVAVLQMASIFVSLELRQELETKLMFTTVSNEILDEMSSYWVDEEVRYKWDTLQRDFQCCGALNLKTGYQDWDKFSNGRNNLAGRPHGVPNSCCLVESDRCGEDDHGIFTDIRAYERIHIHGCLAVMKERLWRDIAPLLLIYIGCGVVICLVTIISLVLASAFVASINRKERHEKDGLGTYQPPLGLHPGTNRYDETSIRGLKQTLDSGLGGGGSLRSSVHTQSPPRTPILKQANTGSSSHRASLYIEPTSESETCI